MKPIKIINKIVAVTIKNQGFVCWLLKELYICQHYTKNHVFEKKMRDVEGFGFDEQANL